MTRCSIPLFRERVLGGVWRSPAQQAVDGVRRFTTGTVTIVAQDDVVIRSDDMTASGAGCDVQPITAPSGLLEVCLPGDQPIRCRRVEMRSDDAGLRVDLDGRQRPARTVIIESLPDVVHILCLPERS